MPQDVADSVESLGIDPGTRLVNLFTFIITFLVYLIQNASILVFGVLIAVLGIAYIVFHLLGFV